jgi:hypothetical protein
MFARRSARATAVAVAALVCGFGSLALADTAYAAGPANGSTISNAAQAQIPFSAGTYDSGQLINVVVPANTAFAPSQKVFILECAAPGGVVPTTINSCDGNTGYSSGTLLANLDGSLNVINDSPAGAAYPVYALPDLTSLGEPSNGAPRCGLGSANQCVLYIGQGGGSDTGLSAPHFFSQPFQVHPDATDSGVLNPGSGTFGADVAPGAISTINHATFTKGTSGSFSIAATGNQNRGPADRHDAEDDLLGADQFGRAVRDADPVRHVPDCDHRRQRGWHGHHPGLHAYRAGRPDNYLGEPLHVHPGHPAKFFRDGHR